MGGHIARAYRNINVENRAHRLVGKDKLRSAPAYPSTEKDLQAAMANNPNMKDKIYKKDDQLLSRLKGVYVESTDPSPQVTADISLPKQEDLRPTKHMNRSKYSPFSVDNIPIGKISIIEAVTLLSNHRKSPETWTAEKLAEEYNLDIKDIKDMLQFFSPFKLKIITPDLKEKISD